MAEGRGRREPVFDARDASALNLRLSREDRAGGEMPKARSAGPARKERSGKPPRKRRSILSRLVYAAIVLGIWGVIAVSGIIAYHAAQLPPIDQLAVPKRPPNIAILAADGTLLANRGETGGRTVAIKELPPYLPKAFVAIEDRRFYDHLGVDPVGIARALMRNLTSRGVAQGGSTLTQQLAKNLFLTQERTASRKIQEAILAFWLERNYAKDQLLELYLNRVYFGAGAYGVEAAAQRYFSKPAREVTLAEAAVLAGLVQAPSRLAPSRNPEAAKARGALVLAAMAELGFVSQAQLKTALANPAKAVRPQGAGTANYAADWVMDVLDDFVGAVDTDIVVTTTIDPALQGAAERALVDELAAKGQRYNVGQGAVVAMRPDGAVKALVGGRNYAESQFNRATAARRQPGSAFKPFVFLAAIERGLTPDTVREDAPVSIRGWAPENYTRDYRGPVTLRDALALSLNTVAVRLGMEVGPKAVVQTGQRLDRARHLGSDAARARRRLCGLRQWRARRHPLRDRPGEDRRRQGALQAPGGRARPGRRAGRGRRHECDDARDLRDRHGPGGRDPGLGSRRQDRHEPGFPRRLVRRLQREPRRRGLARQRRRRADEARLRRQPAGRDLGPLHEDRACRAAPRAAARRLGRIRRP